MRQITIGLNNNKDNNNNNNNPINVQRHSTVVRLENERLEAANFVFVVKRFVFSAETRHTCRTDGN